jgi:hypothetical protein
MDSTTAINMTSHAHTEAATTSVADGVSHGVSQGTASGTSHAVTNMESNTEAHGTSISETNSYARGVSEGQADTRSSGVFSSTGSADSIGLSRAQALSASVAHGLGAGLVPSIGFSKTYQGIDYPRNTTSPAISPAGSLTLEGAFADSTYLVIRPKRAPPAASAQAFTAWRWRRRCTRDPRLTKTNIRCTPAPSRLYGARAITGALNLRHTTPDQPVAATLVAPSLIDTVAPTAEPCRNCRHARPRRRPRRDGHFYIETAICTPPRFA